jgi:hypothetical protein
MVEMNKTINVIRQDEDEKHVKFNSDAEGWNKRDYDSLNPFCSQNFKRNGKPVFIFFLSSTFADVKLELIKAQGCFQ